MRRAGRRSLFDLRASVVLALVVAIALPGAASAAPSAPADLHLNVVFRASASDAERAAALGSVGGRIESAIPQLRIDRVALPAAAEDGAAIAAALEALPAVERAEVDGSVHLQLEPSDRYYLTDPITQLGQWSLRTAQVNKAWDTVRGSADVVVAVLDTGADPTHPDLAGALVPGQTFLHDANPVCAPATTTRDDHTHGTHVAGIVGAVGNNKIGIAGVAFGVKVMPVKVLDCTGAGSDSDIAAGLAYAADHGARIANLSLGTPFDSFALREAVAYAVGKGVLVVAAVGNCHVSSGECASLDQIDYPAAYPDVVGVGATDANDSVAFFSSRNATVDIAAPGDRILSTAPTYQTYGSQHDGFPSDYAALRGTSQAGPFVAGVAALLLSGEPTLTPAQIADRLESTADDLGSKGRDTSFGSGRVNAARAVAAAGDRFGATYDTSSLPTAAASAGPFAARVALTNTSSFTWRFADPDAVRLGWSWSDASGAPLGSPTGTLPLTGDVPAKTAATVVGQITAPPGTGTYTLRLDLARGATPFSQKGVVAAQVAVAVGTGLGGKIAPAATAATFNAGGTSQLPVTLTNTGTRAWPAFGANPVHLSYHWLKDGATVVWEGERAALAADLAPGASATVALPIVGPALPGTYTLRLELVQEGVSWFSGFGAAPRDLVAAVLSAYVASYTVAPPPALLPGGRIGIPVTLTNSGTVPWIAGGATPVHLASHVTDAAGSTVVWDGARSLLPADVAPGASATVELLVDAPAAPGPYRVRVDLVREGVGWFSGFGVATGDVDLLVADDHRAALPAGPIAIGGPGTVTRLAIANTGIATWTTAGAAPVAVGVHFHDASGGVLLWDGPRAALPRSVAPGETVTVDVDLGRIPAGAAFATIDLVSEGLAWFGAGTMRPLTVAP